MALEPAAAPYDGSKLWGTAPNGYTVGPNYWGMTFFAWPPDPNNDWRQLYFLSSSGTPWYNSLGNTTVTSTSSSSSASGYPNNNVLFASSGLFNSPPTGNYQINYKAILAWINANCVQQSPGDGRPFPPILRSSNQIFYSYIPTDVPASAYTWSNPNSTQLPIPACASGRNISTSCLACGSDPTGNIQIPGTSTCSYGPDFTAGASSGGSGVSISGPDSTVYLNGLVNQPSYQSRRRIYLGADRHLQHTNRQLARHRHRDRHHIRREGHRHHRYQPRLRIYGDTHHHPHRRGLYDESYRHFANVHLHEPRG